MRYVNIFLSIYTKYKINIATQMRGPFKESFCTPLEALLVSLIKEKRRYGLHNQFCQKKMLAIFELHPAAMMLLFLLVSSKVNNAFVLSTH